MLQETKLNDISLTYVMRFLPSYFDPICMFNLANNSKGGILIAWKKNFELIKGWSTLHTTTVLLKNKSSNLVSYYTVVYGPSEDENKPNFIIELRYLQTLITGSWILAGDFNIVRWLIDRSGDLRGLPLMDLFNDFINQAALIDIPLKNRAYTWSNKRPLPTFSKLDRVFTSPDWQLKYPIITLESLEMIISDHSPLLLTCKNNAPTTKTFKLETFWLKYEVPRHMVQILWEQTQPNPQLCINQFGSKTELLHRALVMWHKQHFGIMEKRLIYCKRSILFLDRIEEKRPLARHEFILRVKIREKAYELANNIEERWRQRSRCNWIKQGDKNTRFFHAFASSRASINRVTSIQLEGHTITDPYLIQTTFLNHLKEVLGTSKQTMPFNPSAFYNPNPSLADLDLPFTAQEVESAVNQLAKNKASGPDGIPNEFLQTYWTELKDEIMTIIHGFYDHQTSLATINQANVVMIPKKESPSSFNDYRPISILNAMPKLISKILAN